VVYVHDFNAGILYVGPFGGWGEGLTGPFLESISI